MSAIERDLAEQFSAALSTKLHPPPFLIEDDRYGDLWALGRKYQEVKKQQLEQLGPMHRFNDVAVMLQQFVLEPGHTFRTFAYVAKDYFKGLVPDREIPRFMRLLLHEKHLSGRSKAVQGGLVFRPVHRYGEPYITVPIFQSPRNDPQYFGFAIDITNLNPVNTYAFPDGPVKLLRFYAPGLQLFDGDVVQMVRDMQTIHVWLVDTEGQLHSLSEFDKVPKDKIHDIHSLFFQPVKQAMFANRRRIVDLERLLSHPHTTRSDIDREIGLTWHDTDEPIAQPKHLINPAIIYESAPVKVPEDRALILDISNTASYGTVRHTPSPLIDPGFGAASKMGIRFEVETAFGSRQPHLGIFAQVYAA